MLDLAGVIDQELSCTVSLRYINAWHKDHLVDLVDLRYQRLGVLEQKYKLQEPNPIVSNHREHLSLLRPDLHLFLSVVEVCVLDLLERL